MASGLIYIDEASISSIWLVSWLLAGLAGLAGWAAGLGRLAGPSRAAMPAGPSEPGPAGRADQAGRPARRAWLGRLAGRAGPAASYNMGLGNLLRTYKFPPKTYNRFINDSSTLIKIYNALAFSNRIARHQLMDCGVYI